MHLPKHARHAAVAVTATLAALALGTPVASHSVGDARPGRTASADVRPNQPLADGASSIASDGAYSLISPYSIASD